VSFVEDDSAFDNAAAEAVAEVEGTTTEVGAETPPTEPAVSEVTSTTETTPSVPTDEKPWWEDRLDETVDVNGEQVPLKELRQGYLRQADYTRKTQSVAERARQAEWADNLQNHLRSDPVGTLQQMAREFRLIPDDQTEFDPSEVDPYAERFYEVEQRLNAVALRETEQAIRQEVVDARNRYADFNADEVLPMIAELGSQGVGLTIEQGYFLWRGQRAAAQAAAEVTARQRAETVAAAETAKRAQAAQVNGGHSPLASDSDDPARYRGMSFDEIADEVFAGWDS
jgi:hypothetical protein